LRLRTSGGKRSTNGQQQCDDRAHGVCDGIEMSTLAEPASD
jgi:hypothetical protein